MLLGRARQDCSFYYTLYSTQTFKILCHFFSLIDRNSEVPPLSEWALYMENTNSQCITQTKASSDVAFPPIPFPQLSHLHPYTGGVWVVEVKVIHAKEKYEWVSSFVLGGVQRSRQEKVAGEVLGVVLGPCCLVRKGPAILQQV